jgi:hypothetical protein
MGGAAAYSAATPHHAVRMATLGGLSQRHTKPRDCDNGKRSKGRCNETRLLSLMSALRVNSGTACYPIGLIDRAPACTVPNACICGLDIEFALDRRRPAAERHRAPGSFVYGAFPTLAANDASMDLDLKRSKARRADADARSAAKECYNRKSEL